MNIIKLFLSIILCCYISACKDKVTSVKLERDNTQNTLNSFVLDYTFVGNPNCITGEKDSLVISTPLSFNLINNTKNDFQYKRIEQSDYRYFKYFLLNGKQYRGGYLKNNINISSGKKDKISFYFETPISKKDLEKDLKIKLLLNDGKQGDSININKLSPEMKKSIDHNLSKLSFIVDLKNEKLEKRIGIWYCFDKDKAIIYDIDSLIKVNPRYMFKCE